MGIVFDTLIFITNCLLNLMKNEFIAYLLLT